MDGALKDYFEKGKRRKGRKRKKGSAPTGTRRRRKRKMPVGNKGKRTRRATRLIVTPLNSLISIPPKRAYRKTTRLVSQFTVWMTQEQILNQVVSPPFPQPSRDAIIRSIWTMKMMTS